MTITEFLNSWKETLEDSAVIDLSLVLTETPVEGSYEIANIETGDKSLVTMDSDQRAKIFSNAHDPSNLASVRLTGVSWNTL